MMISLVYDTHIKQDNHCLEIQTNTIKANKGLNMHFKQIRSPRLYILLEDVIPIRIITPNQYMTSLLKIPSKSRFCSFTRKPSLEIEVVRQTQ